MNKVGFIGAFDKTDLIIYIAKILSSLGKKVLMIDSTVNQKAKYIVPSISPTRTYITQYENIDVAVGFTDFEEIKEYLMLPEDTELAYDIALIDVDSADIVENFEMNTAQANYFVTSLDLYSIKKGLEAISGLTQNINATKVIFSKSASKAEDDYINFLALRHKITWNSNIIYFPFEMGDQTAIIENQMSSKIKFKKLTNQYKEGMLLIVEEILGNVNLAELRRIMKQLEKGV